MLDMVYGQKRCDFKKLKPIINISANRNIKMTWARNTDNRDREKIFGIYNIVTWNLQGTNAAGSFINLINVLNVYKAHIAVLQETKQKENFTCEMGNFTVFNSGSANKIFGTGFMVHNCLKHTVLNFRPVSERICTLRIKGKYRKISIINVHAPTNTEEDQIKEYFYEEVSNVLNLTPRYDIKIVIGDLNAKVGREELFRDYTGGHSKHISSNDNGLRVIDFAIQNEMKIMSTFFERKDIYKGTWQSPDGKTCNQIDHILIENRHHNIIKNVQSRRGAAADSDHFMVKIKIKEELPKCPKIKKSKIERLDPQPLKNESISQDFSEKVEERLGEQPGVGSVEDKWNNFEEKLYEAARETLPSKKPNKSKCWFDTECKKIIEERNKARLIFLQVSNEENKIKYGRLRKLAKKICRQKKREKLLSQLVQAEVTYQNKDIRNFYQEVKRQKSNYLGKLTFVKDKEGNLVAGKDKMSRWMEHFQETLNESCDEISRVEIPHREQIPLQTQNQPQMDEVIEILQKLKNNKSPGENGLVAELYKKGGTILQEHLLNIIQEVWVTEQMPKRWTESLIYPLYKKGERTNCENYRGITLMDVAYKIFAICLRDRLKVEAEKCLGEYQAGFRAGRSTIEQIYILKEILANSYEHNISAHILFIDFKQAYDSIKRSKLNEILNSFGIDPKLIRLIEMTLERTSCKIMIDGEISDSFPINRGLRQGDPISPIIFNLCLEWSIRHSDLYRRGTILHHKHQLLAYADDIALLTRSTSELKRVFSKLVTAAQLVGLQINESKTKYMCLKSGLQSKSEFFTIRIENHKDYKFQAVDNFVYLGVTITSENNESIEIMNRLSKGNKCYGAFSRLLKCKQISRQAKKRIYSTVIRPTVLYGSEIWALNKNSEKQLAVWERQILRKIYGGRKEGDLWFRRTNRELKELYDAPGIIGVIKAQRLRWLGHVLRKKNDSIIKSVYRGGVVTKKRRGRPKDKWNVNVKRDLRELKVDNFEEISQDRKQWRKIVEEAMGLNGL